MENEVIIYLAVTVSREEGKQRSADDVADALADAVQDIGSVSVEESEFTIEEATILPKGTTL